MEMNQNNEMLSDEMIKSDNNFKDSKLSQHKGKNSNINASKTYNRLPPITNSNSTRDIRHGYNYTLRATKLEFSNAVNNQQKLEYDTNTLKKELSLIRSNLQKRKK